MTIDEKQSNIGRRSGKDRRSGVDSRTEERGLSADQVATVAQYNGLPKN
jgi:hypothetical protein